jgi:hypothetical protein
MSGKSNAAPATAVEAAASPFGVRAHLRSIMDSAAFKSSRRSQEFLQFVVERGLEGRNDYLKERVLGVELFGRSPSYDTAEDAIVRVTACDVRKRLHHYYAEIDREPQFHIELPPGSYIPDIQQIAPPVLPPAPKIEPANSPADLPAAAPSLVALAPGAEPSVKAAEGGHLWKRALLMTAAIAALAGAILALTSGSPASPRRALPWSAMLRTNRPIRLVFCDPDIVNVQRLLNYSVSLSDYANQKYWPDDLDAATKRIFQSISFRGASVAAVDASMALKIDELLRPAAKRDVVIQTARNTRLADFKTEDNFVLLGSPRSDPWVELFDDQLDFSFEFDPARKLEFIRNRRPHAGESAVYVPTAQGWGTGQAYAIVALMPNPQQNGYVLVMAGSNAEATEAAGKLALNADSLAPVLRAAAIDAGGPVQAFEVLLRVSTMAGSSNTSEVVACHRLKGRT